MADTEISEGEAYELARAHDRKAKQLRDQANLFLARASEHRRWANRWRAWADDDGGNVSYPDRRTRANRG